MFRDVPLLDREIKLVLADPMIDMLIVMPHLDMAHMAGPEKLDELVEYLFGLSSDKLSSKPIVVVFHSFNNDPWERDFRIKLQTELPEKGVAVYCSLTNASRALAKLYKYHRFQKELAAENQ